MIIDIFQDLSCPWCRIGKKNLFDALQEWTKEHKEPVVLRYRSFLLNPDLPQAGLPFAKVMADKMGDSQRAKQMTERVVAAGTEVGVPFHFEKIEVMPNTWGAHTLIKWAPDERASEVVEAFYRAYFEEGRNLGELDVLLSVAAELGLDPAAAKRVIMENEKQEEIEEDLSIAMEVDVQGVPFFILDGKLALSGAHPKENFLRAFREVNGK